MDTIMVEVRVPGFVFFECFDPMATEFPHEVGLPEPTIHKVGRGRQFRFKVTIAMRDEMIDHARCFGQAMSFGVDDPSVGQRVLRWVGKMEGD